MKIVPTVASLLLMSIVASADCYPISWRLPSKGKGCKFVAGFEVPSTSQLWNCPTGDASYSLFLITGTRVIQPEGDHCFVVKKVTQQNPEEN